MRIWGSSLTGNPILQTKIESPATALKADEPKRSWERKKYLMATERFSFPECLYHKHQVAIDHIKQYLTLSGPISDESIRIWNLDGI